MVIGKVTEVLGAKCLNQHHFADAQTVLKHPVHDSYTMHVFYRDSEVHMFCPWCMYDATHNVSEGNPVQVEVFSGRTFTFEG